MTSCPPEDFEIAEPRASVLVESLRAFGYDLGSAIADLVDNSISAGARNVWIDFHWNGEKSCVAIIDDGRGMGESTLRNAMRLGSRHPSDTRDSGDLGRFGLGLKTASFSQCRCVTVITKELGGNSKIRRWDLDHLAKTDAWQVLLAARKDSELWFERFSRLQSGTCILWQDLDRILGEMVQMTEICRDLFISQCEVVESHLALIFHRLLQGSPKLRLHVNDHQVNPIDPFFVSEATQILQEHRLRDGSGGEVLVQPFVMPHESKLPDSEARAWAGDSRDWTSRQGFYVYRQDRLLLAGSWLGFRGWRKDEYHKLARIRILLTNSSDDKWLIDVTKRKATPPERIREQLRRIGEKTREKAKRVYTYRGARLTSGGNQQQSRFVWEQIVRHGQSFYRINRDHPMIADLINAGSRKINVEDVLKLIEETIPMLMIAAGGEGGVVSKNQSQEFTDLSYVRGMLLQAWKSLRSSGMSHEEVLKALAIWEPFNAYPQLIAELKKYPPHD